MGTRAAMIDPQLPATRSGETVEAGKSALVLAAIFIAVEIVLMAETISVLLEGAEARSPGGGPIAILLSTALLANLGLMCTFIAATATSAIRRSRRAEVLRVASFAAVSPSGEIDVGGSVADIECAASSHIPTSG